MHDVELAEPTLLWLLEPPVDRPEPDEDHPQGLCLDKGYDAKRIDELIELHALVGHVRRRGEEPPTVKEHPARRWVVERTGSWINRYRALLVRWAKKPENYEAQLAFACGLICFQQAGVFG